MSPPRWRARRDYHRPFSCEPGTSCGDSNCGWRRTPRVTRGRRRRVSRSASRSRPSRSAVPTLPGSGHLTPPAPADPGITRGSRSTATVPPSPPSSRAPTPDASSSDARRFDPPWAALAAAAILVAACQWLSAAPAPLTASQLPLDHARAGARSTSRHGLRVRARSGILPRERGPRDQRDHGAPARAPSIVPHSSCPCSRSCSPRSCSPRRRCSSTSPRASVTSRSSTAATHRSAVTVSSSADDGVQLLGTVEPASTHTVHDLFDQGSTWVFSFSSAGVDLGSIRVSRAALARPGLALRRPGRGVRSAQSNWAVTPPSSTDTSAPRGNAPQ